MRSRYGDSVLLLPAIFVHDTLHEHPCLNIFSYFRFKVEPEMDWFYYYVFTSFTMTFRGNRIWKMQWYPNGIITKQDTKQIIWLKVETVD